MKENVDKIIAYWQIEHTKADRKKHLDFVKKLVKENNLENIVEIEDVTFKDKILSQTTSLGFPATRIDLKLKDAYRNKIWRTQNWSRVKDLSVVHLIFRKDVGVYDPQKHTEISDKISAYMKPGENTLTESQAKKISAWKDWENECVSFRICTNGREAEYKCRNWSGYEGPHHFDYDETWDELQPVISDSVYRLFADLQIFRYRDKIRT